MYEYGVVYLQRSHVRNAAMCLNSFQLVQAPVQLFHCIHGQAYVRFIAGHNWLRQWRGSRSLRSVSNEFKLSFLKIAYTHNSKSELDISYLDVEQFVRLRKLLRTDRRLARIWAKGVTIKSSPPWLFICVGKNREE